MSSILGQLVPACARQNSQPVSFHKSAITHAVVSFAVGIMVGVGLALAAYFLSHFPMLKMVVPVAAGAGGVSALIAYMALRLILGKPPKTPAASSERTQEPVPSNPPTASKKTE